MKTLLGQRIREQRRKKRLDNIVEALDVPADTPIRDSAAPASYVADDELNRKLSRLTPGQKKAATDILNAYIDNIPYIKEK